MYPPDDSQSKDIFVSLGDRVVLNCSADDSNQAWETPLGRIDGNSTRDNQLYILADDFSLVIPSIFDNHTGDYLCISPLREMHYLLFLCPNNEPQEKVVYEGGTVSLACNFGQDVPERVQWHRFGLSDQYEIIYNSQDKTIPIPEDLQHRVTLSENGSSLTIYNLEMNDGGKYGCAALKNLTFEKTPVCMLPPLDTQG
uniref:Ig-like domain-containing protein n=1 Tax=Amphilophus citrinellus TaxID=61819 RepID=A0A3Q0RL23_AMPCI